MTTHEFPFDQVGQALNLMTRETDWRHQASGPASAELACSGPA